MDPVANFLTSLRNGYTARKPMVRVPHSKGNRALATLLKKEGYLQAVTETTEAESRWPALDITLGYTDGQPAVARIRRLSTPGRRLYVGSDAIPLPRTGIGTIILSTPAGLMTGRTARKQHLGGELICEVIRGGSQ